jgi:molybdenum cofactor guanylyltransferase
MTSRSEDRRGLSPFLESAEKKGTVPLSAGGSWSGSICGALVLCGGESQRMGEPKAWLPFGRERMLQRVVRLVGTTAEPVVVVAGPDQELPPLPGAVRIARDPIPGRGPLQGLATGLAALDQSVELVFAVGTDVPLLKPAWFKRLVELIGDCDLAIPLVEGYRHPLAALYRPAAVLPEIGRLLAANRLRAADLADHVRSRFVTADELRDVDPDFNTLRNVNTPADYRAALAASGCRTSGFPA